MKRLQTGIALGLVAVLAVGLITTASAGAGGGGADATAAAGKKKKKKKCPAGTTKTVKKNKKTGKKKISCVPNPTTPAPTPTPPLAAPAALSITPTSEDVSANQAGFDACDPFPIPDGDCPTRNFTVTNSGLGTGAVSARIQDTQTDFNGTSGFQLVANGCSTLAPGASCVITVRFADDTNSEYLGNLIVSATPGNTVTASLRTS